MPRGNLTNILSSGINGQYEFNFTIDRNYQYWLRNSIGSTSKNFNITLSFFNLTNALIYLNNGSVACSNINNCDGDLNISLTLNNYSYVLENFNVTEFYQRQNSPVHFTTASTNLLKRLRNNLTQDINSTIIFNVTIPDCSKIGVIRYNSSVYSKNYTTSNTNVTCQDLGSEVMITIQNVSIEASSTNQFLVTNDAIYVSGTNPRTSDTNWTIDDIHNSIGGDGSGLDYNGSKEWVLYSSLIVNDSKVTLIINDTNVTWLKMNGTIVLRELSSNIIINNTKITSWINLTSDFNHNQ